MALRILTFDAFAYDKAELDTLTDVQLNEYALSDSENAFIYDYANVKEFTNDLNSDSFESLFKSHFGDLVGFVCSYVNDEEVAKDIVHDVFLVVLKNQKKLDTSYSLKSYLFTLSKNYALNYLKHLRVVAMNEREVVEALQNADEELDDYEQRMARLNEKLDELPEKQREVLMKCFVEGQTYKDVADEMGISVNSVKTHISRGLKFLRNELKEEMVMLFLLKRERV